CAYSSILCCSHDFSLSVCFFFFKQKTAYEIGLGIPAEPLFRSLYGNLPPREISMKDVFRSGDSSKKFKIAEGQCIVMRLRMFLLLITFLKASHSFRNRLLVICKNAYLFATMIMTSVSSPFSCCSGIVRLNLM